MQPRSWNITKDVEKKYGTKFMENAKEETDILIG